MSAVSRNWLYPIALILMIFLVLVVYWPGLSGGFVFDDFGNLVDNKAFVVGAEHAHFWTAVWSSGSSALHRPLSMLSFAVQVWSSGLSPWPLKLVNLLIHLINGLLVLALANRMIGALSDERKPQANGWLLNPSSLALLVTAAWLLAPIQLTAVLYVVQRMEALATLFVLLGLLAYWHGRTRLISGKPHAWWWLWGSLIGGTVLATLCKETGVLLPAYAFLIEWVVFRFRGAGHRLDTRLLWLFAVVLFLPMVLGLAYLLPSLYSGAAFHGRRFDIAQRFMTEGRVMVDYLRWIVLPTPNSLSLYHDDIGLSTGWFRPWSTVACWAGILSLIGIAVWLRRRAPLVSLGLLWFFVGQSLVSTVLPLELVYEHRNYLPSLGVFLALFGIFFHVWPRDAERRRTIRLALVMISLGLIAIYAGFTTIRAKVWGSPYRLAYFEATTHPQSPRANYDLARYMMVSAAGANAVGFQLGQQLMEKTSRLENAGLQPLQALIFMSAKNHLPIDKDWWVELRARIRKDPISAEGVGALYSLIQCGIDGVCHYDKQDVSELGSVLATAREKYPHRAVLDTLTANFAANILHDYGMAYQLMLRAVSLAPNNFDYWKNLASMQIASGQFTVAEKTIERMKELNFLGTKDAQIQEMVQRLSAKRSEEMRPKPRAVS